MGSSWESRQRVIGIALCCVIGLAVLAVGWFARQEDGVRVTADEYGEDWPLTVDAGVLRCESPRMVIFEVDGDEYGVNGMAVTRGYAEIDPIWERGEVGPRKNIQPLLSRGLELCED